MIIHQKTTINDLKTVFNDNTPERTTKLKVLKNRLDLLHVQEADIDIIVFDEEIHNYFKADTKYRVIY